MGSTVVDFFLELWVRLSPFRCLCEVDLVTKSAVVWLELESASFLTCRYYQCVMWIEESTQS